MFRKTGKDFRAEIYNSGQRIYLGTFKTAEEASAAYMKKAKELFGEDVEISVTPTKNPMTD